MAKIKFLAFFALIVVLAGCSLEKESPVITIGPSELEAKMKSKESFVLVLGNETNCDSCQKYLKGGLRKLDESEQYKAYYLAIDTVKQQKEMDKLINAVDKMGVDITKSVSVPSTYFLVNGENKESVNGPMVYEKIVEKKEKYGIK